MFLMLILLVDTYCIVLYVNLSSMYISGSVLCEVPERPVGEILDRADSNCKTMDSQI